jgi:thiol-disulfide isomerase/thioredoxin
VKNTKRIIAVLSLAGAVGLASATASAPYGWTKPPTDEQIAAAIEQFQAESRELREDPEARYAAAARAFDFDFSGMTLEQFKQVRRFISAFPPEKVRQAGERLAELARDSGASGFEAAMLRADFVPTARPGMERTEAAALRQAAQTTRTEANLAALRHPALREALQGELAGDLLAMVSAMRPADLAEVREQVLALEEMFTPDFPRRLLGRSVGYFQAIAVDDAGITATDRERIRRRLLPLTENALRELDDDEKTEAERRSLTRARDFYAGAFARGELVGHTAPQIDFVWASTDAGEKPIRSLADLRGKVVVVDFWATWCGPCIGSFPQVRELVAHYQGYPVVVLGVTSIQGYHVAHKPGERGERIDTKNDPEKEFSLMPRFISDMEVTWPVVFSRQDVFNPDFGVRGIPHVAIIDPAGKVRYRGLHPAMPAGRALQDKAQKIDGLLREAGLPTPPPVENGEQEATADR